MNSKDLKDIFDLGKDNQQEDTQNDSSPPKKKLKPTKSKIPTGVSREVFSLLDGKKLPLISVPVTNLSIKPKLKTKAQKWIQKSFYSGARKDHMKFKYWIRESDNITTDYYPARFNYALKIPKFTKEEYGLYFQDTDWSYEETVYLFDLCKTFDLRFHVIYDRYNFFSEAAQVNNAFISSLSAPDRSIESLKARYYGVLHKMIETPELRKKFNIMNTETNPSTIKKALSLATFDKAKETDRKAHLETLYSRSAEEIKEEEILLHELERIVYQKRSLIAERESIMKSLIPFEETVPTTISAEPNIPEPVPEKKTIKENSNHKKSEETRKETTGSKKSIVVTGYSSLVDADKQLINLPNDKTAFVPKRMLKFGSGAFLLSEKISPVPKSRVENVRFVLDHFNISCSNLTWMRPTMATPAICDRFELLQSLSIPLMDFKKLCQKNEAELLILQKRKNMLVKDIGEAKAEELISSLTHSEQ
ncbi:hypothetical protein BB560_000936 [Smittium megazygosporum]|uniref:SWR1-complex protein 4 n=1 Tax=Smittium megazygosporum TaxID=133381 RepID=A0A2T9ZJ21_9FUNG|nr:hypothetical protein BB560_000936 [Smittium megazygosporum]